MYKVIEVSSITAVLLALILAVCLLASLTIGWMWSKNQSLRTENAELLKETTRLLTITEKISHASNAVIDKVAALGVENMAVVNHVCGPQPLRNATQTAYHFTPFSTEDKRPDPFTGMPVEMRVLEYLSDDPQSDHPVAHKIP